MIELILIKQLNTYQQLNFFLSAQNYEADQ